MDTILALRVSEFKKDGIAHGFFKRHGGVSTGIYAGLNIGLGSDDDRDSVIENRARIAGEMNVEPAHLMTVYQVHGDICAYVDTLWSLDDRPKADAMVTDVAGLALGVLTADCTPVLFHGEKADGSPVIGAAHAGWRGAIGGILQSTVRTMIEQGAVLSSIHAAIGPCIQKKSYEVSAEFYDEFITKDDGNDRFFSAGQREGHPHFDLSGYCAATLAQAGVKRVYIEGSDTYADKDKFFSCRRAAHKGETDYGRQMSCIVIEVLSEANQY